MRIQQRAVAVMGLALVASTVVAGEAQAQRGRNRGGAQLTQVSCPNAVATPQAGAAQDALNRSIIMQGNRKMESLLTALGQTTLGIAADANNPHHHFLRGQALVKLVEFHGQTAGAAYTAVFPQSATINAEESVREGTEALQRAVDLCADFATEATTLRQEASQTVYALGMSRFQEADTATALTLWETVTRLDTTNVEAMFNTAVVAYLRNEHDRALPLYRRVLMQTTPGDTATEEMRMGAFSGLVSAGASLFNQDKFREAADVFTFLNTVDPNNRDAWYNHALALYKMESWQPLIPVANRVVELDPLNYNAQIILFNAYKGISDAAKTRNDAATETANRNLALSTLERADGLPVQVDAITFDVGEGSTTVKGVMTGGTAAAGTPIQLEFTLNGMGGPVGTGSVTVAAPAKEATTNFELVVPTTGIPTSYRYRKTN